MKLWLFQLAVEFHKTFRKPRAIVGFLAVLVVIPVVMIGIATGGEAIEKEFARGLSEQFLVLGSLMNGNTATILVLNFLWVHVPLLVTLVAGDTVAGEAATGTLRITLSRRPGRGLVLSAKLVVSLCYAIALVFLLGLLALGLGQLLMGGGDLMVLTGYGISMLGEQEAFGRLLLALATGALAMMTVASLTFFFGVLAENSLTPVIAAMAVIVVCLAISGLPISSFDWLRPWLFTSHFDLWTLVLENPVPMDLVRDSLLVHLGYILVLNGLSWVIFLRKDIRT